VRVRGPVVCLGSVRGEHRVDRGGEGGGGGGGWTARGTREVTPVRRSASSSSATTTTCARPAARVRALLWESPDYRGHPMTHSHGLRARARIMTRTRGRLSAARAPRLVPFPVPIAPDTSPLWPLPYLPACPSLVPPSYCRLQPTVQQAFDRVPRRRATWAGRRCTALHSTERRGRFPLHRAASTAGEDRAGRPSGRDF